MAARVADDKKYFRQILRESRAALPATVVASLSRRVQERVLASICYRNAATVVLYAPKDHEVETAAVFAQTRVSGRRVVYPRIVTETNRLALVPVDDLAELRPGRYGLLEPSGTEIVPAAELGPALICVPGLGFSRTGGRLGRGGGYYDGLLAVVGPQVVSAGLAYSFQLLDRIPQSPGDRQINIIVTESALHSAGPLSRPVLLEADQGGEPRCS